MNEFLLPATALAILFFLMSWAILHSLITGHKTGVITVRSTTYYKNDSRRFHGSDFMAIMTLYAIFGIFILFIYSFLLFLTSTFNMGLIAISACFATNTGISLRRAPTKTAKPNTSFSIISTISAIIAIIAVSIWMTHKDTNPVISIITLACSLALAITHLARLKTGIFYFKYRKPISKPRRPNANA